MCVIVCLMKILQKETPVMHPECEEDLLRRAPPQMGGRLGNFALTLRKWDPKRDPPKA